MIYRWLLEIYVKQDLFRYWFQTCPAFFCLYVLTTILSFDSIAKIHVHKLACLLQDMQSRPLWSGAKNWVLSKSGRIGRQTKWLLVLKCDVLYFIDIGLKCVKIQKRKEFQWYNGRLKKNSKVLWKWKEALRNVWQQSRSWNHSVYLSFKQSVYYLI